MQDTPRRRVLAPLVAVAIALAYPAAVALGPLFLAAVVVLSALAACGTVLARRPSAGLRLALAAIAVWLALGLGGAFFLQGHSIRGLVWVLVVLYLLPLPLIPWLYARTFGSPPVPRFGSSATAEGQSLRTVDPSPDHEGS